VVQLRNIKVIAKREYISRIKSKGFWLATFALPLVMAAWIVVPSLIMSKTKASQKIALVDTTGVVGEALVTSLERVGAQAIFEVERIEPTGDHDAQRADLDQRVLSDEIAAWVWVSEESLENDAIEYHAASVSNFITQEILSNKVSEVVRSMRLEEAGYDVATIGELSRSIDLSTVRISEEGSSEEGGFAAFGVAIGLFFMLYMTIVIYGTQVMLGVLEEKASRVVEVMLAAVAPIDLMAGKLLGICCVALTQLSIWMGTAFVLTAPGLLALSFLPVGFSLPTLSPVVIAHFFGYFLMGFLFFASFYAMIGSAFNNQQEAQQMSAIGVVFLIAPMMVFMPVLNDPDGTLATVMSMIPLFSPLLMILRIATKMPPGWQIALSYVLTLASCAGMVWLAARVYRVGILMYGKKPSIKELWRWIRYS
jgi:ABC-2 type transport system permease protein